jgi:peptidoglycan/LPS O-acetylase OafA/YrhL
MSEHRREYRLRRWPPKGWLAAYGFLALNAVFQIVVKNVIPRWAQLAFVLTLGGLITILVLRLRRGSTVIDQQGIITRGAVRERRRAWQDIHDIRLEAMPSGQSRQGWVVRAYDGDGRRFLLPQVDGLQLEDPTGGKATTEALILRRAARSKALGRATLIGLGALLCMFVLWLALFLRGVSVSAPLLLAVVPVGVFATATATLWPRKRDGT